MALQRQRAIIPLRQGVDLKTADKVVDPTKLLQLENASFIVPGRLQKDNGYADLGVDTVDGGELADLRRVIGDGVHQVAFDERSFYDRIESSGKFVMRDANGGVFASTSAEAVNDVPAHYDVDYACVNGYELLVSTDSANQYAYYAFRERKTRTIVYSGSVFVITNGVYARAVAVGDALCLFWIDNVNVMALTLLTTSPLPSSLTPVTVASDASGNIYWDVAAGSTSAYVAYHYASGIALARFDPVTALTTNTGTYATGVAPNAGLGIGIQPGTENVLVAWTNNATGLTIAGFTSSCALIAHVLENAGATDAYAISICDTGANGADAWLFYYDHGNSLVNRRYVKWDGSAVLGSRVPIYGCTPAHKAFVHGSNVYFGLMHWSGDLAENSENWCCTVRLNGNGGDIAAIEPIAWYMYQSVVGRFNAQNVLPSVAFDDADGEYRFASVERVNVGKVDASGIDYQLEYSLQSLRFYDGSVLPFGQGLLFASNAARDKSGVSDIAFGFAPTIVSVASAGGGSGLETGKSYQYIAVFEMVDAYGNVQRSIPSAPVSVTAGGGHRANIIVALPFTRRANSPIVRLYRTPGDLASPHSALSVTSVLTLRDAATVTLVDDETDATIGARATLYTDGGVLENFPPPMGRCWALHQNRIFSIDEHADELRYTKELVRGEQPAWHPGMSIDAGTDGIKPRALISAANGLWVLGLDKTSGLGAIALLSGQGANDQGFGSSYALDRLDGADVGVSNYRTALKIPGGILFEDPQRGIHLLPAGGGLPVPIGAPIEAERAALDIVAAVLLEDRREVRFVSRLGRLLVYHYEVGEWSVRQVGGFGGDDNVREVTDTCVWNKLHVIGTSGGGGGNSGTGVLRHSSDAYRDTGDNLYVPLTISTAWIRLDEFAGLSRLWDVYVLGEGYDAHALTVTIAYDYNADDYDSFSFSGLDVIQMENDGLYELRVQPSRQEAEAIRITLTDSETSIPTDGRGFGAVALRLEYGVQPRSARRPPYAVRA